LNSKQYSGSPSLLLATVYPEYNWEPWKFVKVPKNMWKDEKTAKLYLESAGKQLGIKGLNDWYKLLSESHEIKDLPQLLSVAYPDYNWEFKSQKNYGFWVKKSQYLLKTCLKSLFPKEG
jgi:hypothetical protein